MIKGKSIFLDLQNFWRCTTRNLREVGTFSSRIIRIPAVTYVIRGGSSDSALPRVDSFAYSTCSHQTCAEVFIIAYTC